MAASQSEQARGLDIRTNFPLAVPQAGDLAPDVGPVRDVVDRSATAGGSPLAEKLAKDPEALLGVLATEELGGTQGGGNPGQAALASGVSTLVGAMVPVMPLLLPQGHNRDDRRRHRVADRSLPGGSGQDARDPAQLGAAGLEMTLAGVIVGGALYAVGLVFKVSG